jgi:hypothetical protein
MAVKTQAKIQEMPKTISFNKVYLSDACFVPF